MQMIGGLGNWMEELVSSLEHTLRSMSKYEVEGMGASAEDLVRYEGRLGGGGAKQVVSRS
jgi:hypothetical protein